MDSLMSYNRFHVLRWVLESLITQENSDQPSTKNNYKLKQLPHSLQNVC
jgi:hypothetical protein